MLGASIRRQPRMPYHVFCTRPHIKPRSPQMQGLSDFITTFDDVLDRLTLIYRFAANPPGHLPDEWPLPQS
jgi:hypothetical protein